MKTATAKEHFEVGQPNHKFPHTGPVYYGTGARPYSAALKGKLLKTKQGYVKQFGNPLTATRAIEAAAKLES